MRAQRLKYYGFIRVACPARLSPAHLSPVLWEFWGIGGQDLAGKHPHYGVRIGVEVMDGVSEGVGETYETEYTDRSEKEAVMGVAPLA